MHPDVPNSPRSSCGATVTIDPTTRAWSAASRRARWTRLLPGLPSSADGGWSFAADDRTVVWSADLVPLSVILEAAPDGFTGARSIAPTKLGQLITEHDAPDGRHLIIADARGEHRLWLRDPTPGRPLAAVIPLDRDFAIRVASLLRFHRHLFGREAGPPPRGWLLTPYRRTRLQQMLIALDMRLAGATYREIAAALGETDAAIMTAAEWKGSRARSFAIRIVRAATAMMNGGYRKLLRIR